MKHPFSSGFNETSIFGQIFENFQISNFTKVRLVAAELPLAERQTGGRTDRQTEMTSLIFA